MKKLILIFFFSFFQSYSQACPVCFYYKNYPEAKLSNIIDNELFNIFKNDSTWNWTGDQGFQPNGSYELDYCKKCSIVYYKTQKIDVDCVCQLICKNYRDQK